MRANLHFLKKRRRGMNGRTFSKNARKRGKKPHTHIAMTIRYCRHDIVADTELSVLFGYGAVSVIWIRSCQCYLDTELSVLFGQGAISVIWTRSCQCYLDTDLSVLF